jgi:hypothetical protein
VIVDKDSASRCRKAIHIAIVIMLFFGSNISGVCWRNWIAHLTTEDDHLCTKCCHQEVPGSSPG